MVETAVSVLPRMGRSRGKCADESKRYGNDPSVIPPSLQQQQQWTPARVSGSDKGTTVSAVSTLPSAVQLVGKSVQHSKSYESDSSDPEQQQQQQQQQSRRQRKNQRQQQRKYRQENSANQFGYGSNGRFRGKSSSSSAENGDYDDNQYHVDDDYNDNTAWMEGLMEEFLESQEMYQDIEMNSKARFEKGTIDKGSNRKGVNNSNSDINGDKDKINGKKIFMRYCDDIFLVLDEEILEVIRRTMLEREQQKRNERSTYTDVYMYQYRLTVKATRAVTCNTKVGHIDGYYKIFEENNSKQSTEVSKSSESNQEQPGVTTRKQQPPLLPPQVQQQKRTTADQTAACSSNRRQQVRVRKRKQKAKAKDKSAKKVWEENGINWVNWKDGNERHSSMDGLVQGNWNSVRVWDTERTERAGGGKAATVTRFRFW
jgi:hypothetical protein